MNILRVNMSDLATRFEKLPEEWKIYGGRRLTAKILNMEVPPEIDPLGKEALLVIATGPLAGTMAPSCGRISVGAKSPLTNGIKEANAGGPTGQKLDKLGIRAIIVEGVPREDKLYLLHMTKEKAVIESADEYRGMRKYALVETLHKKYGSGSSVIPIGVVGERKLKGAAVDFTDKDHHTSRHAARGGLGAVMGAKGLKAIIVDAAGTSAVDLADKEAFKEIMKKWVKYLPTDPAYQMFSTYGSAAGTVMLRDIGSMPVYNFGNTPLDVTGISGPGIDVVNKERGGKMDGCMTGCNVKCSVIFHDKNGKYVTSSYEYEATAMMGTNLGINDPDVVARIDRICDEIGIDVIECGGAIGVAADAGKIKMGDADAVFELLNDIEQGTEFGNQRRTQWMNKIFLKDSKLMFHTE